MQCGHCHTEVEQGAKFCAHCGSVLTQETCQTAPVHSQTNTAGLILQSPAPFPDRMTQYNLAYIIITIVFAIIGIANGAFWAGMLAAALLNGMWYLLKKNLIARGKVVACGMKKYALPTRISTQDISARIVTPLSHVHMMIEVRDVQISVYHDKVEHIITFDYQRGTFIVQTFRVSGAAKLFLGSDYSVLYRYAMADVPLIVFTIQQELMKIGQNQ